MPEVTREGLDSATEAELLGRIALMRAAGFSVRDITLRLQMDMGMDIQENFVQLLQVELGLVKNTVRVEVLRRLLAEGLSPDEANRIAGMIWDYPAKAGIQMAERGISCRTVLKDLLPRPIGQAVRAAYDLCRALRAPKGVKASVVKRLMAKAKVSEKELHALIPDAAPRFRGVSMLIKLPRGFRLMPEGRRGSSS